VSTPTAPPRTWIGPFLAASAIWGCSFLFIKVGLRDLGPTQVAFARTALGAVTMTAWLFARGERLPRGRQVWWQLTFVGVMWNVAPFLLFSWAETRLSSVLAGLFNAATPLFTALVVAVVLRLERLGAARAAGLWVGFGGVLVVLGPWRDTGEVEVLASLACIGATACYGVGYAFTRRVLLARPETAAALTAGQLLSATAVLAVVAAPAGVPDHLGADVVGSMLALGALGTGVAYLLNFGLISSAGPTVASMITYVVPIFSTVAGVVVLDESLTWNQPVGALVVLGGVALTQLRRGSS